MIQNVSLNIGMNYLISRRTKIHENLKNCLKHVLCEWDRDLENLPVGF